MCICAYIHPGTCMHTYVTCICSPIKASYGLLHFRTLSLVHAIVDRPRPSPLSGLGSTPLMSAILAYGRWVTKLELIRILHGQAGSELGLPDRSQTQMEQRHILDAPRGQSTAKLPNKRGKQKLKTRGTCRQAVGLRDFCG